MCIICLFRPQAAQFSFNFCEGKLVVLYLVEGPDYGHTIEGQK